MKVALTVVIVALLAMVFQIRGCVKANYEFEKKYLYTWNLADKSSTIEAKSIYINEFVDKLSSNREDFASHNAIWLKTPDNSFDYNLKALVTLKDRLQEIKTMDVTSFQYNTAIQQITSQEQGEAHKLIDAITGCFFLSNYWYIWEWIGVIFGVITTITLITFLMYFINTYIMEL